MASPRAASGGVADVGVEVRQCPLGWGAAHASRYLRGSAILPSIADAVTVAGDARQISACALPMRPWKLRLLDEMQRSWSASNPKCPPGHAPHPAFVIIAPASARISQ